uniref:Putative ovule protein n=1 Tax=Solanum chacoense TaxID=4108 RepID=A0A0V0GLB8_SOLCH
MYTLPKVHLLELFKAPIFCLRFVHTYPYSFFWIDVRIYLIFFFKIFQIHHLGKRKKIEFGR